MEECERVRKRFLLHGMYVFLSRVYVARVVCDVCV